MAKQLAFYFDGSGCANCKACQVACQDKNNLPAKLRWRRVLQYGGGSWIPDPNNRNFMLPNNVFSYSVSIACMHCQEPLCRDVCPAAAISKRADGVVLIDQTKCIGCRYCEWACPYGAVQFDETAGVMTKCTFCEDLLAEGENPACVDACVMRCLDFGEMDELIAKYGDINAVEPLPSAEITKPSFVLTPHKHAQLSGTGTGRITNLPEEV
jgi:anaerobic dimethyl sulfoxide reductase subunit B (iron-sulfur subunit)